MVVVWFFIIRPPTAEQVLQRIAATQAYITPMPDTYDSLCRVQQHLRFPGAAPGRVTLTQNNFFLITKEVSPADVQDLIKYLNDTASYRWGELGTPEVHYFFTFYDKSGHPIALTTIDIEGQAYSTPMPARMKWGGLKDMARLNTLIGHYY